MGICEATPPGKKDRRRRGSFELCDPSHQRAVEQRFQASKGKQRFLGTWHTHPESVPVPSTPDIRGWEQCREENPDFPHLIFVIVGTGCLCVFQMGKECFEEVTRLEFENDH